MPSSSDKSLPERLAREVANSNLQGVREFYNSADASEQPDLLSGIATSAAGRAQIEILSWAFENGFQIPPESLNNEFYDQACQSHSLAVWKALVEKGIDLNAYHSEYVGDALSLEAYYGNIEIIRFLLENGQDPNSSWAYNDREPGVWALVGEKPSLEILRLLLDHGWKQEQSGVHIAAAELGNMEALELLVDRGANLEQVEPWWYNPAVVDGDKWGTALYRAAYAGQESSVSYLLRRGASISFKDEGGRSIMWAAKQGGSRAVIKLLEDAGLQE
ncbi:hypothetical protein QQS21_010433 [Conoideocrella luteorostrata]|uniref:Ankyrin n=1 Tax=Conoideocrella luteorostrata TaxID=1105319 RepID=A0AAJ0FPD6_9HYPO|nr:hypothetical protein QQS21_010433 [Conoideocrella luteorostrata]